jgi:hypothetical protein
VRAVVILVAAAALVACGHVELHELVLRAPSAPARHAPEVYFAGRPPPRAFYEVALLQAIGYGDDANMEDLTRALAGRATQLGCDAVVRVHVDQGYTRAHAFGVCVKWSPVAAPPAPSRAPASPPVTAPPAPPPAPVGGESL